MTAPRHPVALALREGGPSALTETHRAAPEALVDAERIKAIVEATLHTTPPVDALELPHDGQTQASARDVQRIWDAMAWRPTACAPSS